jgi:uncharacterized protein (DUF736 family)
VAIIGSFKKSATNEFQGEIVTLSVQAKGVRIVPETGRMSDNAPDHRVFAYAQIGAAWSKRSVEGRDYLSVKLADPSFTTPIYANLFDDEGGDKSLLPCLPQAARARPAPRLHPKFAAGANLIAAGAGARPCRPNRRREMFQIQAIVQIAHPHCAREFTLLLHTTIDAMNTRSTRVAGDAEQDDE